MTGQQDTDSRRDDPPAPAGQCPHRLLRRSYLAGGEIRYTVRCTHPAGHDPAIVKHRYKDLEWT